MKRLFLVSSLCMALPAMADSSGVNSGASMTSGPSSNAFSISAASNNPAMASFMVAQDENWRLSYFPTFGFNVELGQVDNFVDDLEELADIIDDPSSTDLSSDEVIDKFNAVLVNAGEEGYLKTNASFNLPLMPLYYQSDKIGGAIAVDFFVNLQGGISILDAPLSYNNQNGTFTTATAIYLKAGVEKTLAVSYSRQAWKHAFGTLYAGTKLKLINLELSKQLLPLEQLADDDIGDLIVDEYDNNLISSTEFAIDFGFIWDAETYRLGLTLENVNAPEFNYGDVGIGCDSLAENTNLRTTCEVAKYFSQQQGEISAKEVYTKDSQLRVDGLYKISDGWQVTAAMDLVKYNGIIGDEHQWFHGGVSYDSSSYIPSFRLGYHKNLAGTKTSSLGLGVSLFKVVALDVEYGLEDVVIDGSSAPRRFGFSLSVQESF